MRRPSPTPLGASLALGVAGYDAKAVREAYRESRGESVSPLHPQALEVSHPEPTFGGECDVRSMFWLPADTLQASLPEPRHRRPGSPYRRTRNTEADLWLTVWGMTQAEHEVYAEYASRLVANADKRALPKSTYLTLQSRLRFATAQGLRVKSKPEGGVLQVSAGAMPEAPLVSIRATASMAAMLEAIQDSDRAKGFCVHEATPRHPPIAL